MHLCSVHFLFPCCSSCSIRLWQFSLCCLISFQAILHKGFPIPPFYFIPAFGSFMLFLPMTCHIINHFLPTLILWICCLQKKVIKYCEFKRMSATTTPLCILVDYKLRSRLVFVNFIMMIFAVYLLKCILLFKSSQLWFLIFWIVVIFTSQSPHAFQPPMLSS